MFRRTQDPLRRERSFDYRAVTSYGGPFQTSSSTSFLCNSVQSVLQPQEASLLVWANPVSLAATQGIAFAFSSSGYLDVSVPRVCLLISYEFRYGYHSITSGGFPHSEISGSKLICQLPEAYRRLSRPSSPIIAKASTTCSYSLDPITLTSAPRCRRTNLAATSSSKCLPGLSPGALCRIQFALIKLNIR